MAIRDFMTRYINLCDKEDVTREEWEKLDEDFHKYLRENPNNEDVKNMPALNFLTEMGMIYWGMEK